MSMKLWRLERTGRVDWDEHAAMVVRAESEKAARALAAGEAGNCYEPEDEWTDPERSTCDEVLVDGEPAVVLIDTLEG